MARSRTTQRQKTTRPSQYELPEPQLVVVVDPSAGIRASAEGLAAAATDAAELDAALGRDATMTPLFGVNEDRLRFEASVAASGGAVGPRPFCLLPR